MNLDIDLLLNDPQKAWQQSNAPSGTLIVVTFDESDFNALGFDTSYDGPNQICTVLLGGMIAPGTVVSTPYNHYNLIRTVEENFSLGSLMKMISAQTILGFCGMNTLLGMIQQIHLLLLGIN